MMIADYFILVVFVVGFILGLRNGKRLKLPHAEKLGSVLAIVLLFATGLSLGSSWLTEAFTGVLPLSLLMAFLAIALSLLMAELLWRNFS
jgi:uncharacterized membrane protein YbjE (DUF340 family)